jgi:hypothetical protein
LVSLAPPNPRTGERDSLCHLLTTALRFLPLHIILPVPVVRISLDDYHGLSGTHGRRLVYGGGGGRSRPTVECRGGARAPCVGEFPRDAATLERRSVHLTIDTDGYVEYDTLAFCERENEYIYVCVRALELEQPGIQGTRVCKSVRVRALYTTMDCSPEQFPSLDISVPRQHRHRHCRKHSFTYSSC